MNSKLYGMTVAFSAVATMILSVDAMAQTTTREAVKAEAAASAPAISTNRQGDQTVARPAMSTESRAAKKAEAAASRNTGSNRVGDQTVPMQPQAAGMQGSKKSRADVKAEAAATSQPRTEPQQEGKTAAKP